MNPYPYKDKEVWEEAFAAETHERDLEKLELRIVAQMHSLYGAGAVSDAFMTRLLEASKGKGEPPKPAPTRPMADRVMGALVKDADLLFEVASRLHRAAVLGPWTDQEERSPVPERVNWTRRFDPSGEARSLVLLEFDHEDRLLKIEWRVYLKGTGQHQHYAGGECETVLQAQREADEAAREAGWMLAGQ